MNGSMMQQPLLISSLLVHAERHHGEQEVVSRRVEGDIHRTTYRELAARSRQDGQRARARSASRSGERVATLAWNGYRHFELYYAVSGSGAVLHTLNPRLHPDQVVYIADHAEDQALFFDLTFLPLVEAIAGRVEDDQDLRRDDRPRAHAGDEQDPRACSATRSCVDAASDVFAWPEFDENQASSLCYTSGTTGNPKGVLYSHRSTLLHTFAIALPDALNCSARDVDPAGRADVPRQRLGPAVRGLHERLEAGLPGPGPRRQVALRAVRDRGRDALGRRADGVAGPARLRRRQRPEVLDHAAHDHRRLGLPAGDDEGVPGALRRAGAARLGHDRDEPGRHGRDAEGRAGRAAAPSSASRSRPSRAARSTAST